jgi:hypothetical protein
MQPMSAEVKAGLLKDSYSHNAIAGSTIGPIAQLKSGIVSDAGAWDIDRLLSSIQGCELQACPSDFVEATRRLPSMLKWYE